MWYPALNPLRTCWGESQSQGFRSGCHILRRQLSRWVRKPPPRQSQCGRADTQCFSKSGTLSLTPHGSLGLSSLPEWELAVTVLVSTVPFLGMGSVFEAFLVGLALADRLPLSKRLTSSSSVPAKNPRPCHQAPDPFLSPKIRERMLMAC